MANNRDRISYPFGDLNRISPSTVGPRLDLVNTEPLDAVRLSALDKYRADAFASLSEFRGIVLRVDKNPVDTEASSWVNTIFQTESKPRLITAKIRIPEIHAMLPEPRFYGANNGSSQKIIDMYPTFVAAEEGLDVPTPGSIVRCDFGNRKTLEDPIYLGLIWKAPEPPPGVNTGQNSMADKKQSGLATRSPEGDPLGNKNGIQTPTPSTPLQAPIRNLNNELTEQNEHTNPEDGAVDYPRAGRFETAYRRGEPIGQIEVVEVSSRFANKANVVMRKDVFENFKEMHLAAARDGVSVKANSGFRTNRQQEVLYRKFRNGEGPLAAEPGFSSHQSGVAVDIDTGGPFTKTYRWLAKNAHRFGFINSGRNFSQPEYWHWLFVGKNSQIAQREGKISLKEKQSAFI